MTQERLPSFFDDAPTVTVQDALADFLGAAENGILTYHYADAVRLCGHSCPTRRRSLPDGGQRPESPLRRRAAATRRHRSLYAGRA